MKEEAAVFTRAGRECMISCYGFTLLLVARSQPRLA
jgi:hypothetical protein